MWPFNYQDQASFQNIDIDLARAGNALPDGRRFIDITYDGVSMALTQLSIACPVTVILNSTDESNPNKQVLFAGDSIIGRFSTARVIYPALAHPYVRGLLTLRASKTTFSNTSKVTTGQTLTRSGIVVPAGDLETESYLQPGRKALITGVQCQFTANTIYPTQNIGLVFSVSADGGLERIYTATSAIQCNMTNINTFQGFPLPIVPQMCDPHIIGANEQVVLNLSLTAACGDDIEVLFCVQGHYL